MSPMHLDPTAMPWVCFRQHRMGWLHLATKCNTHSQSRNGRDGGPRALRDQFNIARQFLSETDQALVDNGDRLTLAIANLIHLACQHDVVVTLENAAKSSSEHV